jgi:uncharacterized protein
MSRLLLLLISGSLIATAPPASAETPRELKWADLVPKSAASEKKTLKPFFGPRTPAAGGNSAYLDNYDIRSRSEDVVAAPAPRIPEGKFMSRPVRSNRTGPPEIKSELDGELVKIGGYVVPLDFNSTQVTEFLLVPFVGACIHVPPPPANQIVYVKAKNGFEIAGDFDPVYVTGRLSARITPTGLAETGYTIDASAVEKRKK